MNIIQYVHSGSLQYNLIVFVLINTTYIHMFTLGITTINHSLRLFALKHITTNDNDNNNNYLLLYMCSSHNHVFAHSRLLHTIKLGGSGSSSSSSSSSWIYYLVILCPYKLRNNNNHHRVIAHNIGTMYIREEGIPLHIPPTPNWSSIVTYLATLPPPLSYTTIRRHLFAVGRWQ